MVVRSMQITLVRLLLVPWFICLACVERAEARRYSYISSQGEKETPYLLQSLINILLAVNPSFSGHALGRSRSVEAFERRYTPLLAREASASSSSVDCSQFGSLSIPEDFGKLLRHCGYHRPLPVQQNAMRKIADGDNVVLHSATGSGKTLAFLVPLLANIQLEDSLRIIIVVPSQELAIQMATEVEKLLPSQDARSTRVLLAISSKPEVEFEQADKLFSSSQVPQVLVGTPQRLCQLSGHPRARPVMRNLRTVVFDEVDLMIPSLSAEEARSHKSIAQKRNAQNNYRPSPVEQRLLKPKVAEIFFERISKMRSRSAPPLQVISCSATITEDVRRKLGLMLDGKGKKGAGEVVTAAPFHATPKRLQKFGVGSVQIPSTLKHIAYLGANVNMMIKLALEEGVGDHDQILMVIPNGKSVPKELKRLQDLGLDAVALQDALGLSLKADGRVRPAKGETLQSAMLNKRSTLAVASSERSLSRIILTNEHSARGMDLKGITKVIAFGIPQQMQSYIHVVGRTAREGRKGTAVYLLSEPKDFERLAAFKKALGVKIDEVDVRFL